MSATAYSTRRFSFAAGHRYWVETWPAAENERVFGRLTVSHGHNYTVDVTVRGPIDERTGMVIDLGELKRIVGETVVDRFDHADLNTIKGIAGTLSSEGEFSGKLAEIDVRGKTSTPNFSIDVGGRPVPLQTEFHAVVE